MPRYDCDGCGACCRTYPIYVSHADAAREPRIAAEGQLLPRHVQDAHYAYRLFRLPFHEACCFLDADQRCTIYESRPNVCRHFAAGESACQEARRRSGLPPLEPVAVPDAMDQDSGRSDE